MRLMQGKKEWILQHESDAVVDKTSVILRAASMQQCLHAKCDNNPELPKLQCETKTLKMVYIMKAKTVLPSLRIRTFELCFPIHSIVNFSSLYFDVMLIKNFYIALPG